MGASLPLCFLVVVAVLLAQASASHRRYRNEHGGAFPASLAATNSSDHEPYRTAFHFQPPKNWMNDPNGPMFYKGYYHLFYQWNPYAATWGNITWGHAVSTDMLHWQTLEPALFPDQWYDLYGCWSGSATFIQSNKPALMYTGCSNVSASSDDEVQMQSMAVPEDYDDPLLRKWRKIPQNPLLVAPNDINSTKFRDPTTGWIGPDGIWRMLVGAKRKHRGVALLYKSSDFIHWEKAKHPLYSVGFSGMWECPDFFPVFVSGQLDGLDTSAHGPGVLHVLKVSLDETRHDHYTVGTYFAETDSFVPVDPTPDPGIGFRYDYGKFYASKTFYDSGKRRRILFGWVNESTTTDTDIAKGWSSLQCFPRQLWLDGETKRSLLQWPIEEVQTLHTKNASMNNFLLETGSIVELKGVGGAQLDVEVEFDVPNLSQAEAFINVDSSNVELACSQVGTSRHGVLGPFGLLVLASEDHTEQTALFFYVVSNAGGWKALICSDQSRSSLNKDLDKTSYGSFVTLTKNDISLRLRALVDHSIVETFAQGGKVCITSRVYPTKAVDSQAHLYVFNNGTTPVRVRRMIAWEMATSNDAIGGL